MSYPEVWLTKSGFEIREYDPDIKQMVTVEKPKSMLYYLRMNCHIESGVTLGDLFNAVDPHPDLIELIENWAWCDVKAFHEEVKKPTTKPCDLHYIEISKYIEMDKFGAGCHLDVSGIGPIPESDAKYHPYNTGDVISWAIEFTPVNELVNVPLRFSPYVKAQKIDYDGAPSPYEDLGSYPAYYTLLDLTEIYYEISFMGSPASRDAKGEELRQMKYDNDSMTPEERKERLVEWKPDEPNVQ